MAQRAFQQAHDIAAILALSDRVKDRFQCGEIPIDDILRVLRADINAIGSQIALAEHFLCDQGLVG